jgi:hypothetical protein
MSPVRVSRDSLAVLAMSILQGCAATGHREAGLSELDACSEPVRARVLAGFRPDVGALMASLPAVDEEVTSCVSAVYVHADGTIGAVETLCLEHSQSAESAVSAAVKRAYKFAVPLCAGKPVAGIAVIYFSGYPTSGCCDSAPGE